MFEHLHLLFQRISVVVQRFDSVLLHDGLLERPESEGCTANDFYFFLV